MPHLLQRHEDTYKALDDGITDESGVLNNRRHENKCSGSVLLHTDITQKPPIWSAITLSNQEHLLQQRAIHLAETDHDTSLILLPFTSPSLTHTYSNPISVHPGPA